MLSSPAPVRPPAVDTSLVPAAALVLYHPQGARLLGQYVAPSPYQQLALRVVLVADFYRKDTH